MAGLCRKKRGKIQAPAVRVSRNGGTVVGEDPTPYVISALWVVNGP